MPSPHLRVPVAGLAVTLSLLSPSLVSASAAMGHASRAPLEPSMADPSRSAGQEPPLALLVEGSRITASAMHAYAVPVTGQVATAAGGQLWHGHASTAWQATHRLDTSDC